MTKGQHTNDEMCSNRGIHQRVYAKNTTSASTQQPFLSLAQEGFVCGQHSLSVDIDDAHKGVKRSANLAG